jgi:hypothetical protein
MNDTKPALPEPFDWCYEWDGPYGTRKFSAASHNGMKPARSVPIYRPDQMHAYADQCTAAAQARIAEMETAIRRILEEPSNTMSDGKALKEIVRIARAALASTSGAGPAPATPPTTHRRAPRSDDNLTPRWYCVSKLGLATLCNDEADARETAADADRDWPKQAPHRAVLLGDVAALAAQAAQSPAQPVPDGWKGEEWESLAWHLCAEENGEEACNELIWEGGPIPQPWGDRWMKYEPEAKRMIELVRRFAPPPAQPAPPNRCKLIQCRSKPRCAMCLEMDAAYRKEKKRRAVAAGKGMRRASA